ncbi:MAG: hypothetical protein KAW41_06615 [Candidatus Diapherotrites archaeon]|nr:hypothetical protein [Candidatus Diapherotrites archaeon]
MCWRSGRGFVFSLEALVAVLCFAAFITALSSITMEDYSDVVLYKQAGDYAQIAMKKKCEHNSTCLAALREKIGRAGAGEKCASVTRTAVTPGLDYEKVVFTLCV